MLELDTKKPLRVLAKFEKRKTILIQTMIDDQGVVSCMNQTIIQITNAPDEIHTDQKVKIVKIEKHMAIKNDVCRGLKDSFEYKEIKDEIWPNRLGKFSLVNYSTGIIKC